jgi:transcription initiation factor TFIIB
MSEDLWNLFSTFKLDDNASAPSAATEIKQSTVSPNVSSIMRFAGTKSSVALRAKEIDEDVGICKFCDAKSVVLEEGNYFCKSCCNITNRFIDSHAEWRYYGADDNKGGDPSRCGMPVNELLPESSLGSLISNRGNESYEMRMIRKYHMWNSMSYKERSLYNIFDNITQNASNNDISTSIIEEAKMFYKKISESKITRGDNRNGLIASSIYMSCKSNKVPRSTKEIAKIFNIKLTTMTKGCKKFKDIVKMNVESTKPDDFIARFASKLNLNHETRTLCLHVIEKADELGAVSENTPPSIAASAIYLAIVVLNLNITKKDLATACGISQVTLTKCYKKMYEKRGQILPKEVILKYSVK